jgi:DNA-directed RNA polymerase specialized sigma24 family protein
MSQEPVSVSESLIPPQPMPCGATAFTGHLLGMLDGQPKDETTVKNAFEGMDEMFDLIAAGLYSLASMLVGEGEDSVQLVETAIATADVSSCSDAEQARKSSRVALSRAALQLLDRREPGCLAAPKDLAPTTTCIQDDDLDTGGVSGEELAKLMSGPQKERVREWLATLPIEFRVIFGLRAVAGLSSPEVATQLAAHGGPKAATWTSGDVREIFRQALCSLASQVIHATNGR